MAPDCRARHNEPTSEGATDRFEASISDATSELAYAGKVEHGLSDEEQRHLLGRLEPLRVRTPSIELPRASPKALGQVEDTG